MDTNFSAVRSPSGGQAKKFVREHEPLPRSGNDGQSEIKRGLRIGRPRFRVRLRQAAFLALVVSFDSGLIGYLRPAP
jgi:hypothetical protein